MLGVKDFELNEERFLGLLTNMVGEAEHLQNNPAQGLIPREDAASDHIYSLIKPYLKENGGVLEYQRISYVEGRGNVILKYPGTTANVCSFVGSHLDVVPADAKEWERCPFKLIREGDLLYGRGTTDCLGHVAALTDFFINLAINKPVLRQSIVAVFIANEENGAFPNIGVDALAKEHYLDDLKGGPLFWVDAADSQPCQGTAGVVQWQFLCKGKLFHSGLPHKGINSIEFAMDVTNYVQSRFYADFPQHPKEVEYKFITSSTLKPTQIRCASGSLNQICPNCTVEGDIRLTPFYNLADVKTAVERYVAEVNANPNIVLNQVHGPFAKYVLPAENKQGVVELKWLSNGENGVACNMSSPGYEALIEATRLVLGKVEPYSINGSLPLIRELQDEGFDVQISGYGSSSHYHANNECVSLEAMKKAAKVFANVSIALLKAILFV
jgi:acetylornithine deacetylase